MKIIKKSFSINSILIIITFILLQGFGGDDKSKNKGFDLSNLDRSINPAKDFYHFAVGGWIKANPLPDEYARWGSFEILEEQNLSVLKKIFENSATDKGLEKGSARQKIGDFYSTGMDTIKIENDGYKPIIPKLEKIDNIKNKQDFIKLLAEEHQYGNRALFSFFVNIDAKNSNIMAPHLYQGGLGLPDVENYLKDEKRSKEIRDKYVKHIMNMFNLINLEKSASEKYARVIMKIETQLAKFSNTRLENRDPEKTYNKLTMEMLKKISGGFDWKFYFESLGIGNPDYVIVAQPKFITNIGILIDEFSLEDWKIYFKWNIIRNAAGALSTPFVNESFDFNSKFLTGTLVMQPRWKRVLQYINRTIGELVGQLYVAEVFPPESKEKAKSIVNNLLVSMGESIKNLKWMGDETKKQAVYKLSKFGIKIGYPDKWKDYSSLQITRDSYFQNLQNTVLWESKENYAKIGKPVDKTEWGMSPQTVNAYYSPQRNEIVFPAAILQPPFFNPNVDDAINYGAMGAVIGHEITHGFDDQGKKFDADGNIKEWWTKEDNEQFQSRAKKLIEEFDSFVAIDTFRVNGALTLGENIGDLGGLTISFAVFKKTKQFNDGELIDGFTPSQRFFLSWAQIWAQNIRPQALKLRLKTDVHSPGQQRVIGPLKNIPEFFEAFNVKPGDEMRNPDDKIVKIW